MKNGFLLIILITLLACKNTPKQDSSEFSEEAESTNAVTEKIIGEISLPPQENWKSHGVQFETTNELFNSDEIYRISPSENDKSSTFLAINNVKIGYTGGRYRISIVAKAPNNNSNIGIRLQEIYPTRTDVVLNLEDGSIIGKYNKGDFTSEEEIIVESLGDGWFVCNITADIYASYIRLLLGPTTVPAGQTRSWEAESLNNGDREIWIVPSSLKIVELEQ